jgi:hypothetical protein
MVLTRYLLTPCNASHAVPLSLLACDSAPPLTTPREDY